MVGGLLGFGLLFLRFRRRTSGRRVRGSTLAACTKRCAYRKRLRESLIRMLHLGDFNFVADYIRIWTYLALLGHIALCLAAMETVHVNAPVVSETAECQYTYSISKR